MTKEMLPDLLYGVLRDMGGRGSIIGICKRFWSKYENELKNSGDLFYTWQYDIRWAATALRKTGRMKDANLSPSGIWEII